MTTLHIKSNESFSIDVSCRESDKYSEAVFLKFERNYHPEKIRGVNEMFVTPDQLEILGKFLINQSNEIRDMQRNRKEQ